MADRELRFDVNANDRASGAFARIAAAAEAVANRIAKLDGKRAKVYVDADTSKVEAKLAKAQEKVDELTRKRNVKIDADTATVQAKVDYLKGVLNELEKKKVRPEVQLKIDEAQAKIAKLENDLRKLGTKEASPTVRMQTALAHNQIAQLRASIAALSRDGADPKVTLNIARAEAMLAILRAKLAELSNERSNPQVDLNIAAAMAKVAALRAELATLRNQKVEVKVDQRGFVSILSGLRDVKSGFVGAINSAAQFMRSLRMIAIGPGLASLGPTLIGIAAAAQTAAGALNILPGAISVVGLAFATLSIGFSGFKDALGKMDTAAQVKKVNKALSLMGDGARNTALEIRAMGPAWNSIKAATQNALFSGLSGTIKDLGAKYLPVLKTGFSNVATSFNGAFRGLAQFMTLPSTIDDVNRLFSFTAASVGPFGTAITNIVAAFRDMAVVGGSFMPGLAQSFANVTNQFRNFIATARADGSLQTWIARGISQIKEFGSLIANIGGIFGGVFDAIEKSGQGVITTMKDATAAMEAWVKSGQGQSGLIALFQGLHEALATLRPGIEAIFNSISAAIVTLQPSIIGLGTAISSIAIAVAPTIEILATMANAVIPALVGGFAAIIGSLSGVIPMVIAFGVAFKVLTSVSAIIMGIGAAAVRLGESLGMMALAFGASGAAAQSFATAGAVVGRALAQVAYLLPGIGIAILAGVMLWDTLGSHAEENANKVVKGAMSMTDAINDEAAQIERTDAVAQNYGNAIAGLEPSYQAATTGAEAHAKATESVNAAFEAAVAKMAPMEALQARLTRAETEYQQALQSGDPGRIAAATEAFARAKANLTAATDANTRAMQSNTDALKANADQAMAAANSQVAAERANQSLETQQQRYTETLKTAKPGTLEYSKAVTDLKASYLEAASAAAKVAADQAAATGVQDTAGISASALKDKLLDFAKTAPPAVAAELQKTAAAINTNKTGMSDATVSAEAYKTTLLGIATEAGGPLAEKIRALIPGFDALGGAHATAEQKAKAQAAALRDLANGAAPDVAAQLNQMAAALESIPPEKTINVNGNVQPATQALNTVLAAIDAGAGYVTINGNKLPVDQALAQVVAAIGSAQGTVMINGQPAPAQTVLQSLIAAINAGQGTVTVNGNPVPARTVIQALINWSNSTPSTHRVIPDVGAARAAIAGLQHPTSSTHTVRVVYSVAGRPRVMSNSGGIAGGGVVGYAAGGIVHARKGFVLPGYSPGRDTVPAVLSPGEAVLVPELVRQIGARNILAANASASGRKAANIGRIPASWMGGARGASSAAGMARVMASMSRAQGSMAGSSSSPDVVAAIRMLSKQMSNVNGRVGAVENHFNNTFKVAGSPNQIASAVGQRQRAEAELGGFRGR